MIEVRLPRKGDIEIIGANAAEAWVRDRFTSGADFTELMSKAYVADINGPVATGGFIETGFGAIAWSLVGPVPRNMFTGLCRVFTRQIRATPYKVIEAHCIETFQQSHRWVRCLGFEEIDEQCFTPDGRKFRKFVFRNNHGA